MNSIVAILGAPDPEMNLIEGLLEEAKIPFTAALKDGRRVHPGNAYKADSISNPDLISENVWLIETDVPTPDHTTRTIIDHHRPGDPGFGLGPDKYLWASSLGQVIMLLAKHGRLPRRGFRRAARLRGAPLDDLRPYVTTRPTYHADQADPGTTILDERVQAVAVEENGERLWAQVPRDLCLAAAADHCLGAAYRGLCPGVRPDELRRWRLQTRADFQGVTPEDLNRRVEAALDRLRSLPGVCIDGRLFLDARSEPEPIPELPEAAAIAGRAVVYRMHDPRSGRTKEGVLNGTPEDVEAWMKDANTRLVGVYGDPARGFAGGYEP